MTLELRRLAGAVEVAILVQPRSAQENVGGTHAGALRVRVHAAPAEGQANEAVRRVLAKALGARAADVQLVAGDRSRRKRVRIEGDPEALSARLQGLAHPPPSV